jgi:hypothetical protein
MPDEPWQSDRVIVHIVMKFSWFPSAVNISESNDQVIVQHIEAEVRNNRFICLQS